MLKCSLSFLVLELAEPIIYLLATVQFIEIWAYETPLCMHCGPVFVMDKKELSSLIKDTLSDPYRLFVYELLIFGQSKRELN